MPRPEPTQAELLEAAKHYFDEYHDHKINGAEIVAKNDLGQTVVTHTDIVRQCIATDAGRPSKAAAVTDPAM